MRRAACAIVVVAAIAAATSASGDVHVCDAGVSRPCTGTYPDGTHGDASTFLGSQRCVARGRGSSFGACEAVACREHTTSSCSTAQGALGVAQCQRPFRDDDDALQPLAFGACATPRECRPYETRNCPGNPSLRPGTILPMACAVDKGAWKFSASSCDTPLVLSFDGAPVAFTRPPGAFTIGSSDRTEWVDAKTPWLAFDRDGNGVVDDATELFAGFEALAAFDDDHDGRITPRDAVWSRLRVWRDTNQDRRATPDEMTTLDDERVTSIDLAYASRPSLATSYEGETATFAFGDRTGRIVDVHLVPL